MIDENDLRGQKWKLSGPIRVDPLNGVHKSGCFALEKVCRLPRNWETLKVTTIKLCRSLGSPCRGRCLGFQIRPAAAPMQPSCSPHARRNTAKEEEEKSQKDKFAVKVFLVLFTCCCTGNCSRAQDTHSAWKTTPQRAQHGRRGCNSYRS